MSHRIELSYEICFVEGCNAHVLVKPRSAQFRAHFCSLYLGVVGVFDLSVVESFTDFSRPVTESTSTPRN